MMGDQRQGEGKKPRSSAADVVRSWLRELVEAVLPALVIVLVANIFFVQATRVEGQSMDPILHDNERLIIEKISYRFHSPQRGDIVVLRRPQRSVDPLIKRIVGLPGETVTIHDAKVYINGEPLSEPYLDQPTGGAMAPVVVPEGYVFVMGDNRRSSNDSRVFGVVSLDDIIGRAWLRYWPLSEFGPIASH